MKFQLEIGLGNAAFTHVTADETNGEPNPGPELARILRQLADRLESEPVEVPPSLWTHRNLFDHNGNPVGEARFADGRFDVDQLRIEGDADDQVRTLIEGVKPDAVEPIQRGDVYDSEALTGWTYMLGGGGPTTYGHCIGSGSSARVIVEVTLHSGQHALRVIDGPVAATISERLARASRGDLE